jgi:hypothetical protein
MRWITGSTTPRAQPMTPPPSASASASEQVSVRDTLLALPTLLDGSSLPNGVVELLIEDFEAPTRQLFDIHNGHVTLVEAGSCVPWASIAGPATAWTMALGPERDTDALRLTGDESLARQVLTALPRRP